MSVRDVYRCDLCGDDKDENNFSLQSHIFGVIGERNSPDYKMNINNNPSTEDDFHICGSCLKKLCDLTNKISFS